MIHKCSLWLFILVLSQYANGMEPKKQLTITQAFKAAQKRIKIAESLSGKNLDTALDGASSPVIHVSRKFSGCAETREQNAFFQVWPILDGITTDKLASTTLTVQSFVKLIFEKSGLKKEQLDVLVPGVLKKAGCTDFAHIFMIELDSKNKSALISQVYDEAECIFKFLNTSTES